MNRFIHFLFLFAPIIFFGQTIIKGKVVDQNGNPISYATIQAEISQTISVSNAKGLFEIEAKQDENLEISSLSAGNQTIKATSKFMTIKMQAQQLQEISIGYGTVKKRDLAGSIAKVDGKTIADKPNTNPISSLQGKVAGLTIINTGELNKEPDIRIRGTASRYGIKPLYVIDGIFNDNMDYIDSNNVESIEILKDPSSLAIFGVRGANGVIIVTTKQGKQGKLSVNYNTSYGNKFITGKPNMTNAEEFKKLYNLNLINQGLPEYQHYDKFNADTDWIDQMTEQSATFSNHNLSFTSGNDKNKIYIGLSYLNEEGLSKNSKLEKYTLNINDELKISDKFKIGVGLNFMRTSLPMNKNYNAALFATPIAEPFNKELGIYNQLPNVMGAAQLGNPLLEVEAKKGTSINIQNRIVGNIFVEYKFLKDFTFKVVYMGDISHQTKNQYNPVFKAYSAELDQIGIFGNTTLTSINEGSIDNQKFQQDYLLTWNKKINNHNITALGGFTTYSESYKPTEYRISQYSKLGSLPIPWDKRFWHTNAYDFVDLSTLTQIKDTGDSEDWLNWERTNVSGLFRVLYNYKTKYIFNGSLRRDATSAFTKENPNRWQTFWSLGAAWEITKERFLANNKYINTLKLKGSIGRLGNQASPNKYPSYPGYVSGASAIFNDQLTPALVTRFTTPNDLHWEIVDSYEFGLETYLFNKRLSFEANYYNKETKDLLNFIDDGSRKFYINAGNVQNKGFEFTTSWNDKITDNLNYFIGGNLTTLNNKVKSIYQDGYTIFDGPSITRAGDPIGSFYGYVVEGIYQSSADVLLSPVNTLSSTYGPGDLKFKDINGDERITPEDRTIIGNPTPDFTYGFNLGINYKNWTLAADFQGVFGNEIYRDWGNGSTFAQLNFRKDRLNAWNGEGTSNWEPIINESSSTNKERSTYMIEDGSYLRLRNIQIAYNFAQSILEPMKIQNLKLFVNAQNLVTWRNNSGFVPEIGGSPIKFGVDEGGYPLPIVTTFGVNVQF